MPSKQRDLIIQISQISDAFLIAAALFSAHYLRESLSYYYPFQFSVIAPFRYYKWLYLILIPIYPFVLDINGFYDRPHNLKWSQTIAILTKSIALCTLIVIAAMYFFGLSVFSRGVILIFAALGAFFILIKDQMLRSYMRARIGRGVSARPILLVGSPEGNAEFEKRITEHPEWNIRVSGKLDPNAQSLKSLPIILHTQPISCVVFNVEQTYFSEVAEAIRVCETEGVEAWLVADFVKTSIAKATVDDFYGKPLLVFRSTPDITWQLVSKRLLDVIGSGVGLLIVGPLIMLPTAVAIKLTSPGPILFRQKRSGVHGKEFDMYKFRSMVTNAEMLKAELAAYNEQTGPVFKIQDDPRITPIGKFLRKTSIDELPQLWNILLGHMSLVGPRPPIPDEVKQYDPWHRRRLSMKPGLTCLWQISGRNNVQFDQWMKLDLQYIDNWSLWLDIKILLRTIPVVLGGFGAH